MASEIPPFAIDDLVQPYLRPDNAVAASKRITKALGLMFRCQLATPDRKKWETLERLVVPVRGKRGRYRLYGRGFYKDEGVEISWTPAHEREIAQTLGYGDFPPWHDMPTNLPRILYPPGRFTEEHLRQIREEERKEQTQRDEAHPIRAAAVGEIAVLKAAPAAGTPTTKPRHRGIQIRGVGRKRGQIARHSNSRPADQPRLRGATVNSLGTEQRQRANTPIKDHLGERMASQACDVRSDRTSESSEEYTPATESSDNEWEGHDRRKRSRVACTKIEKQQEIESLERLTMDHVSNARQAPEASWSAATPTTTLTSGATLSALAWTKLLVKPIFGFAATAGNTIEATSVLRHVSMEVIRVSIKKPKMSLANGGYKG